MSAMFIIEGNSCDGNPYDFQTGLTKDGRQVVMGLLCPNLVAYFFSADGVLLDPERRLWNYPASRMEGNGPFKTHDREFMRRLAKQMAEWKREIGFSSKAIRVEQFFDEEGYVGIEMVPEFLANLDWCEDEEEREETERQRQEWVEQGKFVFYWAKDYHMTADGAVEST